MAGWRARSTSPVESVNVQRIVRSGGIVMGGIWLWVCNSVYEGQTLSVRTTVAASDAVEVVFAFQLELLVFLYGVLSQVK